MLRTTVQDGTVRLCLALQEIAKLLQSGWAILHSHPQGMRVPAAPHPCPRLLDLIDFLKILVFLIGVSWYLMV